MEEYTSFFDGDPTSVNVDTSKSHIAVFETFGVSERTKKIVVDG